MYKWTIILVTRSEKFCKRSFRLYHNCTTVSQLLSTVSRRDYVDDTFTKMHAANIDSVTQQINSINPHIKFTSKQEEDSKLPFLDMCVHVNEDGSTKTTVYRKPPTIIYIINIQLWRPSYTEQNTLSARRKIRQRKYGTSRMLYSQMVTNAGCLKSLLNPAPQVRRTAPRRHLDQPP